MLTALFFGVTGGPWHLKAIQCDERLQYNSTTESTRNLFTKLNTVNIKPYPSLQAAVHAVLQFPCRLCYQVTSCMFRFHFRTDTVMHAAAPSLMASPSFLASNLTAASRQLSEATLHAFSPRFAPYRYIRSAIVRSGEPVPNQRQYGVGVAHRDGE